MATTYYLTEDISQTGKKLGSLTGWRKEIAKFILDTKSSEEETTNHIRNLINGKTGQSENAMVDELIPLLPKNTRNRAKILAYHLMKHIKIGNNGQVVYPDGTTGASFVDHIKYWCGSFNSRHSTPFDQEKMAQLLEETNAPKSCLRSIHSVQSSRWLSL